MKIDEEESEARATRVLMTVALALWLISIIACGMGRYSNTGQYYLIGYRFFFGSLAVFIVVGVIWLINWIKTNVRIK